MLDVNWNPSRRDLRQFGAIWCPLFAAAAGVLLYRAGARVAAEAIWGAGALVLLTGLAAPGTLKGLFVVWMALAYPIGWAVSHAVLGLTYFGMFTLVGGIMRLVGYDPLARQRRPGASTYWNEANERARAADYFRQF
jgi:hypothetical protein